MSLFPHIWAIPAIFLVGCAVGWFLRGRVDSTDSSSPPPRILEDD